MIILSTTLKACLVGIAILTQFSEQTSCPQHAGSDPNDVNDRIMKLAGQDIYYQEDEEYRYKISICQTNDGDSVAIQQFGKKWDSRRDWVTVGRFGNAHVTGGTDWLMITYPGGDTYNSHCGKLRRQGVLTVTCDPGVTKGEIKIIEEFRTNDTEKAGKPFECYYLFELNNEAACTGFQTTCSILSIVFFVIATVSLLISIGALVRYYARAKRMERLRQATVDTMGDDEDPMLPTLL